MRSVATATILIAAALSGCARAEFDACVDRGIAYYQEIGSWPTLSDNRDALEVVRDRCNRTSTAF